MITVVIPTLDSERLLVPTLAALVPGSAEGLVREVFLADGGSRDGTRKIADAAGCEFLMATEGEGERLRTAARAARGDWLLFLDPGAVLTDGWTREVGAFISRQKGSPHAATFALAIDKSGMVVRCAEIAAAARLALFGVPRPDQGLLIAKVLYESLGGHPSGANARRRMFTRVGRSRLAALRTTVTLPG
jgi:glycosyltransferase involved in cell wall biosynthesis